MHNIEKCLISDRALLSIAKMNSAIDKTEWCGVALYYPNPLMGTVTVIDVIPQAVGDPAYTKVEGIDAVLPAWAEELDCSQGFIHSHHVMATNPSTTDIRQVEAGMDYAPYYLSLIVNHHGKYTCLWGCKAENDIKRLAVSMEFGIKVPKYVGEELKDRMFRTYRSKGVKNAKDDAWGSELAMSGKEYKEWLKNTITYGGTNIDITKTEWWVDLEKEDRRLNFDPNWPFTSYREIMTGGRERCKARRFYV